MFKIKQRDINDKVMVNINSVETDYEFETGYEMDENTQQILTDAGYELEEIIAEKKEVI